MLVSHTQRHNTSGYYSTPKPLGYGWKPERFTLMEVPWRNQRRGNGNCGKPLTVSMRGLARGPKAPGHVAGVPAGSMQGSVPSSTTREEHGGTQ